MTREERLEEAAKEVIRIEAKTTYPVIGLSARLKHALRKGNGKYVPKH